MSRLFLIMSVFILVTRIHSEFILIQDELFDFTESDSQDQEESNSQVQEESDSQVQEESDSQDPETNFDTNELIEYLGYPSESHKVTTEDGYIIKIFRIPRGKSTLENGTTSRPPVFLQHGLFCSSDDWVINYQNESLSYMLADAGYDVWLGNIRGNKYGLEHVEPLPSREQFYTFSWDEIAEYDIPAIIDYILMATGYEDLQYIGHSMGTTVAFALLSTKLDYNSKIRHFHALAPVATLNYVRTPFKYLAPFVKELKWFIDLIGGGDFLPSDSFVKFLSKDCDSSLKNLCQDVIYLFCGYDPQELNTTRLPLYLAHTPAGSSSMTIAHYAQEINDGFFQRYDYGISGNYKKYNQRSPPKYEVEKISAPVTLYWGQNDLLAGPQDVAQLASLLTNCNGSHQVGGPNYSHMDFIWGVDDAVILNYDLISKLQKY